MRDKNVTLYPKYIKMTLGPIILLTYLNPCGSIGYDKK
jgi:hypothetical protein